MIRLETERDIEAVRQLNCRAFGHETEAKLVDRLREGGLVIVSLVAEQWGEIVGHILFSRLEVAGDAFPAASLGPMAVLPERQRQGIGSALIQEGLRRCRNTGIAVVLVVGHAGYYPRFGFSAAAGKRYRSPYSKLGDAWMALELAPLDLAAPAEVQYPEPWSQLD
ncbi:MAG: N-acetyltransferase [Acidobacteria bacterium]|nr:N-acetyltransferase [Acidobacteriota bacterium]